MAVFIAILISVLGVAWLWSLFADYNKWLEEDKRRATLFKEKYGWLPGGDNGKH